MLLQRGTQNEIVQRLNADLNRLVADPKFTGCYLTAMCITPTGGTPGEFAAGHVPGALNIPVDDLRGRLAEVPRDKSLAVYCGVGLRAYLACRILDQEGFKTANLSGGFRTWMQFHPKPGPEAEQLRKAFTVESE